MITSDIPDRCRLVLIAPPVSDPVGLRDAVARALDGGDVASVILPRGNLDDASYQAVAELVVPEIQSRGAAAILEGDTRIAGRVGADGVHVDVSPRDLAELVEQTDGRMIVGAGGAKTRHDALELGEARPDYLFFGRFAYDDRLEVHPRNITLGSWWAEIVEIPCLVLAGKDPASVLDVAATGAEFVAVGAAVFAVAGGEAGAVRAANALLDETAPKFSEMA